MRITFHGHRPTGPGHDTSAVEASSAQRPPQANANEQLVKTVNFGFFKVKVHRKTAAQASLLAQLRGQAGAAPAQPASTRTEQVSSSQSSQVDAMPGSGSELPNKLINTASAVVELSKPSSAGLKGHPPESSVSKLAHQTNLEPSPRLDNQTPDIKKTAEERGNTPDLNALKSNGAPTQQVFGPQANREIAPAGTSQATNTADFPKFFDLGIVRSDSNGSDMSSLSNVSIQSRHKRVITQTQTQALPELKNYTGQKYREQLLGWINGDENCTDVNSTDYRGQPANETRLEAYRRICGWLNSWEQPEWTKLDFTDLQLNTWPPLPENIEGRNIRLEL